MALKLKVDAEKELPQKALSFKIPGALYRDLNRFRQYVEKETGREWAMQKLVQHMLEQHLKSESDFQKVKDQFDGNEASPRTKDGANGAHPPAASPPDGGSGGANLTG